MDTKEQLKDMVGNPLSVGDRVALDVLSYKRSALRVGNIQSIEGGLIKISYFVDNRKITNVRNANWIVKVASE